MLGTNKLRQTRLSVCFKVTVTKSPGDEGFPKILSSFSRIIKRSARHCFCQRLDFKGQGCRNYWCVCVYRKGPVCGAEALTEITELPEGAVFIATYNDVVEYFNPEHLACADEFAGDADVSL